VQNEHFADQRSWAQQMFNFPDRKNVAAERNDMAFLPAIPPLAADRSKADIVTGSVSERGAAKGDKRKGGAVVAAANDKASKEPGQESGQESGQGSANKDGPANPPPAPNGRVVPLTPPPVPSAAERAILERLQERRQELDERARELDIREGLIGEAEKRVDAKLTEIKEGQAQLAVAAQKKDEAARLKSLVTMYETMKPCDAAKIFDRLDIGVLLEVASQINPRNMSEIMAQMSPDRAQQLTVEMANRAQATPKDGAAALPKIEGRPTGL
jgi:flagellar motility protein MotE (MotC chaperone)